MKKWMIGVALLCALAAPAWARPNAIEQAKIDFLIATIAHLQGATFIRNGKSYDAERAADHLRLKLRFAGSKITTARDFIAMCATRSSMSGVDYSIRFADGHVENSGTFLLHQLAVYEGRGKPDKRAHSAGGGRRVAYPAVRSGTRL